MQAVQLVLLLLLVFVVVFGALARRLQTPFPIVLLIAGLALSFIPGIPRVTLDPDFVFFVFLPPLLYAGAWTNSWRDFSYNLVSICSLTFALVAITVLGVAFCARWAFGGFDWRLGVVLGAVVAPTDAIAATTIAKRLGLPRRIVDVLEGESLVNDATGLLALEFGIAMVVYGQTPDVGEAALRLCWLIAGGIGIGLVLGRLIEWLELRIDDAPIEITTSILVPYAAYLAAQAVRSSGVLAVVASGLYLSRQSTRFFSPRVRIQIYAVWNALTFILNGVVFVLIGLQLPYVLAGIRGQYGLRALLLYGALFSAVVVLLRLFWVFPGARLAYFVRRRILGQRENTPPARQIFVVGWTGMRGVIALAAALALPQMLSDGRPFPQRNLIIFLTFVTIFATLVVQGLTLRPLIRFLKLEDDGKEEVEENKARLVAAKAGASRLDELEGEEWVVQEMVDDMRTHYAERRRRYSTRYQGATDDGVEAQASSFLRMQRELLTAERQAVIKLRDAGVINDEVLRRVERDLDLEEQSLRG